MWLEVIQGLELKAKHLIENKWMHLNDPGGDSVMLFALNPDIFLITFSNEKVIGNKNDVLTRSIMTHYKSVVESTKQNLISIVKRDSRKELNVFWMKQETVRNKNSLLSLLLFLCIVQLLLRHNYNNPHTRPRICKWQSWPTIKQFCDIILIKRRMVHKWRHNLKGVGLKILWIFRNK